MEPTREQFIVNLPHNSSPTNTPSNFRTRLPHVLKLNDQWEVALYSIIYPKTWGNVGENTATITVHETEEVHMVSVEPGQYDTIHDFLQELNRTIGPYGFYASVTYRPYRVSITAPKGGSITFDDQLRRILGLDSDRKQPGTTVIASRPIDLTFTAVIYVHTDIIEVQITGDRHASLLQSVPGSGKFGDVLQFSPRHLLFLPLRNTTITDIEIKLTDAFGELIKFTRGDVIVQLLFRRAPL